MPEEKLGENLIEKQLKANEEVLKGASVADLVQKDSAVYRAPEIQKEKSQIAPKPQFDEDGFPVIDTLRTYQGDIASAVQHDNLTMSKIALLEQNKRGQTPEAITPPKTFKTHLLIGIAVSILFVVGVGAVIYSFIQKNKANAPVTPIKTEQKIITAEENINLDVTHWSSGQILEAIDKEVKKVPKDKAMREVVFQREENILTLPDFLQGIGSRVPGILLRNLYDNFFFGINFIGNGSPFIIMYTSSYDIAYSGLLEWEGTLGDDLKKIFAPGLDENQNYNFKDEIIGNKDARALEDKEGKILFFYTFLDKNTIVFAKDAVTLEEVTNRLRIESLKKQS